ncbi:methionine--tRNA ligase [Solitalea canadensis]|uniref:Methionine--tRNA ligase n=1 Tax=Solitalea canadensis (strain ATCC 29591 / DSM 3403 / JCM 21819 / LMG 8368 / NBRC 15130 / NCIMB 12057 / USAM 9D) TaxID=929556 RepID=H8KLX3_SOLCM|nr:methionine--tRNA ligase [Solitalea canadensis]AFD08701.1 protein containing C-terminal region/beta chain of methionyl-tRNA synthetase [Solitalea canadensis DSM 3403]
MKQFKRYTVTSALPYTNGPVHIGHLAGAYLPADIFVRYLRSKGREVVFICGSDEHGVPITIKAKAEGVTPQQVVDKYHKIIGDSFRDFGISFDIYHRTSSQTHHETSADFFKKLYDKGEFIVEESEQYFDEKAHQFLADRYITGTCPECGYDKAYGDQCESCGSTLNATELINPKSTLSGEPPVLKSTKHWYLPLDKYQPKLEKYILEDHQNWKTNVFGQCKSWLSQGLQPRAVTRDLEWGVPVPVEGAEGKVLYVWFDAPIGYISATKELFKSKEAGYPAAKKEEYYLNVREPQSGAANWEEHWKSEDTKLVHFIGKDNIVFHCLIFPAMLMADGTYTLADDVPANEFLNLENNKISTSRNWAVWLNDYLVDFKDKQDVLRYVLCSTFPETKDNDFTWKDYQARNNNELVAIFGNFINRVAVLTHKYYEGVVPALGTLTDFDKEVIEELKSYPAKIGASIEAYRFREAMQEFMNLARLGNKYLADTEPWKLIKTDEERVKTIMNIGLQIAANLSVLAEPFIPFSAKKLADMLNLAETAWDKTGDINLLPEGDQIAEAALLFEKVEDSVIEQQLQKLEASKAANEAASKTVTPAKENITFDEFSKMDIRVGTILAAEKVAKTKKLLKLTIDTGIDQRTVVSGIAEYFEPENIIGQQVSILVNLAPREIKGIESQGMILMAEDADGKLCFAAPTAAVKNGSEIR